MHYGSADIPIATTNRERNALPAARHARQRYGARQSREYAMKRPFIAWDGEGITREDGSHEYVLLAGSEGTVLTSHDGSRLRTVPIFRALLASSERNPGAIHVIYGGGYDFNKWFTDFDRDDLQRLYSRRYFRWGGFVLGWRRGKSLFISHPATQRSVTIFDVVSFFQTSFVSACDAYLRDNFQDRDLIVENKSLRSSFSLDQLDEIMRYNEAELVNLVALCNELRDRLDAVNLRPKRWDGPGAIASTLLQREGIRDHLQRMDNLHADPDASRAARCAYAGGRFEVVKFGHVDAPAYEYDINSAYPAAMRTLPSLSVGRWIHRRDDPGALPFALYHVRLDAESVDWALPFPLPRRSRMGNICYPQRVDGWYWSPEVAATREWCELTGAKLTILESWEWIPDTDTRPFAFIEPLYRERQVLKAAGNGAHVGIKLGLNSLY